MNVDEDVLKELIKARMRRRIVKHVCFVCGEEFNAGEAKECPKCEWLICPVCGKCYCHLTPEAKRAVDALEETYCKYCPFER